MFYHQPTCKTMPLLPAAIGIILNDDHTQVLLIKRRDVAVWVLPGGGVEICETPEEALLREVQEETGLKVHIVRKCAEYTPINRLAAFTTVYLCASQSGHLSLSNESAAIAFYPINQLPPTLFPPHAIWLQEALSHSRLISRPLIEISYSEMWKYFIHHPWLMLRFCWTRFIKS